MKQIAIALCLALSAATVLALPPAIELDRLMLHAKTALDESAYDTAVAHFAQAQKLGIALPENFSLGYATALAGQGRIAEAKSLLDKYLNKYGTKGASYKPVLALLVRLENTTEGKSKASAQPAATLAATTSSDRPPQRPTLPFAIDESIWRTLENAEMYRNAPKPRALRTRSVYQDSVVYTGAKSMTLTQPPPAGRTKETEFSPVGDKCLIHRSKLFYAEQNRSFGGFASYICGGISLGSTNDGVVSGTLTALGPLSGSLYPPRIGAEQRIQYESAFSADRKFDSRTTSYCRITGRMEARQVHARLTGTAWVVQCHNEIAWIGGHDGKTITSDMEDYLIEDLGILASAIGVPNMAERRMVVPIPGSQSTIVAEGEYGSRTTSTYSSHDWAIGEPGALMVSLPGM